MMRFALQPAARRGGRVATTLRYGPAAVALAYPLLLMLLHRCGRQLAEATTATAILAAGVGVSGAAALIVGVPLLSFVAIRQSDDLQTRRLAHLAFAAPPLFTATGLVCLFLGMPGGDTVAWGILWTGALFCAARKSPATETTITRSADWIRTAHGLSAGVIIGGFVIWHLANHVVALWSLDHNKSIMDVLRPWYRSDLVQPLLLALLLWQLFSGLRLLWAKLPSASDLYSSIQTATAAYLAVYVPSHLIAVLVLGRWLLAVDTNFAWASGAPTAAARSLEREARSALLSGGSIPHRPSRGRAESRPPQSRRPSDHRGSHDLGPVYGRSRLIARRHGRSASHRHRIFSPSCSTF
jgi:hypothetical protein